MALNTDSTTNNVLQKMVPVQLTDMIVFDDYYPNIRARFAEEMRKINDEMDRFSKNLIQFYSQSIPQGVTQSSNERPTSGATTVAPMLKWENLMNSTLVVTDGELKTLKLQFDVNHFSPDEVKVNIVDNMIVVSAEHEEILDSGTVHYEFNREFMLPKGIDADAIVSSISRDGVLTIQAPMPPMNSE